MVKQLRSKLGMILLLVGAALFSGQTTAQTHGHLYLVVKSADMLLRHQADSDEIRQAAEDSAADFREQHFHVNERRPGTYQL
ncbi:DUF2554 family protein [Buttiauxella selenatireducens]|uniref:DUF2554 family protein n=1 Tax=Buttiauxella selenatireducens TaxID=3073902 RepID=A0ABY9SG47_9ENTR|nr:MULTISPECIES: DUF2554 family protein [unclassified Buttiauxella]WMY76487.1 DUF2554 family protein [Buttiauxella sp. R73]